MTLQTRIEDHEQTRPLATRLPALEKPASLSEAFKQVKTNSNKRCRLDQSAKAAERIEGGTQHQTSEHKVDSTSSSSTNVPHSPLSRKSTKHLPRHDGLLLETKRRQLLAQADWVGLAPRRPVQTCGPVDQDKENLGKRRKSEKMKMLRKTQNQIDAESPFARRHVNNGCYFDSERPSMGAENISVRIGTAALQIGTSESQFEATPGQTHEVVERISQTPAAHSYFSIPPANEKDDRRSPSPDELNQSSSMLLDATGDILNDPMPCFDYAGHNDLSIDQDVFEGTPLHGSPASSVNTGYLPRLPKSRPWDSHKTLSALVSDTPSPRKTVQTIAYEVDNGHLEGAESHHENMKDSAENARRELLDECDEQTSYKSDTGYLGLPHFNMGHESAARSALILTEQPLKSPLSKPQPDVKALYGVPIPVPVAPAKAKRSSTEDAWRQFIFGGLQDDKTEAQQRSACPRPLNCKEEAAVVCRQPPYGTPVLAQSMLVNASSSIASSSRYLDFTDKLGSGHKAKVRDRESTTKVPSQHINKCGNLRPEQFINPYTSPTNLVREASSCGRVEPSTSELYLNVNAGPAQLMPFSQ